MQTGNNDDDDDEYGQNAEDNEMLEELEPLDKGANYDEYGNQVEEQEEQ